MDAKQIGNFMRHNQQQGLEGERAKLATVTHTTLWGDTEGTIKATLSNGDLIWVEASGIAVEVEADDQIYVQKIGAGADARWRMVGWFSDSGGSHTPALRQAITSKIHELYASDGDPQAADVDASGNVTFNPAGGDQDFIVEGNTEDHLLVVDAGADVVRCGDWDTNYAQFAKDGELTLVGTAKVTDVIQLPLQTGGGTSTIEVFNGAASINLDADTETFFTSCRVPGRWDAASNLTLVFMVANEIAEDDGDDVSITAQVRGYADGETTSNIGQGISCTLNLTGGDQAINVVNRVTGTIVYNHGTYPIAAGDTLIIKGIVNLGGAGECTGPLHIIGWWIEYTKDKLGTAT